MKDNAVGFKGPPSIQWFKGGYEEDFTEEAALGLGVAGIIEFFKCFHAGGNPPAFLKGMDFAALTA